jgi:predicted nucleic acid-binding protein
VKGYLVDPNIPSELTREKPDARVAAFLRSTDKNSMYLSVMTIGEICKGIATLQSARGVPRCRTGLS